MRSEAIPKERTRTAQASATMVAAPAPNATRRRSLLSLRLRMGEIVEVWRDNPLAPLLAEQDRWFLWVPVGLAFGVVGYFSLPSEPSLLALALLLSGMSFATWRMRHMPVALALMPIVTALVAGCFLASLQAHRVHAPAIQERSQPVEIRGIVRAVEDRGRRGTRYRIAVAQISGLANDRTPANISITRRGAHPVVPSGHMMRMRAILMPPPDAAMPGGYDFARRAYFDRVGAVGFALGDPIDLGRAQSSGVIDRLRAAVGRTRESVATRIADLAPGRAGAIAAALIVGKRERIDEETRETLRAAGLAHILAISGLHMALVAGGLFLFLRRALALAPGLALNIPVRKYAAGAALVVAGTYLALSGASVSAQRAFVMVAIMFLAVMLDRPALTLRNVALAAIVVIMLRPSAVMEAGFQMSFAATAALVAVFQALRVRRLQKLGDDSGRPGLTRKIGVAFGVICLTALVGSLATAPFAAYHFNRVAPYSLLGNVLAMPVVSFAVMPSGLATGLLMPFGLEAYPLRAMTSSIDVVHAIAAWVAALPAADASLSAQSPFSLLAAALGVLWLIIWRGRWRFVGIAGIALYLLLAFMPARPPDVLIGQEGEMVAVRGTDGRYAFAAIRRSSYVIETWLRRAGDPREGTDSSLSDMRCRTNPCRTEAITSNGKAITIALQMRHEAAASACADADVVVLSAPLPEDSAPCEHVRIFTPDEMAKRGAIAIYLGENGLSDAHTIGARDGRHRRIWHNP